jgi:hypothetical protein
MRWRDHCSLGQDLQQTIAIKTSFLAERDSFGNRLHSDAK